MTKPMTKADVSQDIRSAGLVRRYHTWPVLHHQTIAEHTWQVMRLYVLIFEQFPRSEVWYHMLFHDIGEVQTGDIPYPMKRNNHLLKHEMDILEHIALLSMNITLPELGHIEYLRFKFCDLLDCAEQGQYEARLGNQYMGVVADQRDGLCSIIHKMDDEDRVKAKAYCLEKNILVD